MPPRNLTILSLAGMVAVSPLLNAGDNAPEELARLKQILAAAEYIVVSQLGDPPDPGCQWAPISVTGNGRSG